jgi:hypothetical protein
VYSIKKTPVNFQHLNLEGVMNELWIEEVEKRRQERDANLGWEELWKGTPCFVNGSNLAKHATE